MKAVDDEKLRSKKLMILPLWGTVKNLMNIWRGGRWFKADNDGKWKPDPRKTIIERSATHWRKITIDWRTSDRRLAENWTQNDAKMSCCCSPTLCMFTGRDKRKTVNISLFSPYLSKCLLSAVILTGGKHCFESPDSCLLFFQKRAPGPLSSRISHKNSTKYSEYSMDRNTGSAFTHFASQGKCIFCFEAG